MKVRLLTMLSFLLGLLLLLQGEVLGAVAQSARGYSPLGGSRIVRDAYGVPHVYANTLPDLFFACGYVTAQDRLSQLELYRRAALGRLAEAVGAEMLEADQETRRELYTSAERMAQFAALPADQRQILEAYRDGINARLAEVLADPSLMPYDLKLLGITPEPWQVTDSIAIMQFVARRFEAGGAGGHELDNQILYQDLVARFGHSLGEAVFNDVVWLEDPAAPTTIPGPSFPAAAAGQVGTALQLDTGLLTKVRERLDRVRRAREAIGLPTGLGSYAWAVNATRSATGNAMLFGGPQMGHTVPNVGYEIGLHGAGFNVVGMSFAGAPGSLIGHNGHIAWTATAGFGDQVDVYVELLHPTDRYRYWHNGAWHDMSRRTETIHVADAPPVTIEVCRTVHGPILEWDLANGIALSERRAQWDKDISAWAALLDLNRASTVGEAMQAVEPMPISCNFLFADQGGRIGYRQAGRQAIRTPGFDPRLPLPGQGQAEWQGFVEPHNMPHILDPTTGALGNWNNKPMLGWVNGDAANWGVVDRVQRIMDLLGDQEPITPEWMKEIAYDIGRHDYRADALLPHLLRALESPNIPADPRLSQAAQVLRDWDHRADEGAVGETLFDRWRTRVLSDTFGDELGTHVQRILDPFDPTGDSLLLRALEGEAASLPVARDYFNGLSPDLALVNSLIGALDELTAEFGTPDMAQWGWDPGTIKFVLGPLTFGEIPWHSRGSYMQFVELTHPWARGENILPPGESGTILEGPDGLLQLDPHFLDQLDMYRNWEYKPMPLYNLSVLQFLPLISVNGG